MSEKGNQAVKTVSFMMLITLFGKILGMVREQLLAANYGTDMLYYDDFDRYAFDDAAGDGVCKAADASDCARL